MFKYDSVHGRFKGTIEVKDGKLYIEGKLITVFGERDSAAIPWGSVDADYVVESTVCILPFHLSGGVINLRCAGCVHYHRQVRYYSSVS